MVLCIYHNADHDGRGSAAIVKSVYPDVEFCGFDHGMELPIDKISRHDKIIICDIALPVNYMFELNEKIDLTWIDHHVSVINEYDDLMADGKHKPIKGIRKVGTASIELTWNYYYPDQEVPEGIKLLALNDLYDLRDERVRPFEYAVQAHGVNRPGDDIWVRLMKNEVNIEKMVEQGRAILSWVKMRNFRLVRTMGFESELNGMKCLCANMPHGYSEFFNDAENLEKYDFLVNFYINKSGRWKMTFYANKPHIDATKLAEIFGGGGHKGAAGALLDELPTFLNRR